MVQNMIKNHICYVKMYLDVIWHTFALLESRLEMR